MGRSFPKTGRPWTELEGLLSEVGKDDVDWRRGRNSGMVYFAGDDILQVAKDAHSMFFSENGVSAKAFPSIPRMEAEVIDMSLALFHGGETAVGNMTSGGTESIFLAIKTARDWARENRITEGVPEIVAPHTVHPAFNRAASYLGLKVTRVHQGPDFRADVTAMTNAISADTIMLVGSAPAYPHGVMDPIGELGKLAQEQGLWLHVDACVGGFHAPFVKKLGYPVPDFDLGVPGVTSISADMHKYGFTAKGASTVLYQDAKYYRYQGFEFDNWPRGRYSTQTFTGTRSGGPIAASWAVLNYLGEEGYLELTRKIMRTKQALIEGINSIKGLEIWGDPELGIMTFGSHSFDIFAVADGLSDQGWFPNRLVEPPGIHLLITPIHEEVTEEYLSDLASVVERVRAGKIISRETEVAY